MEDRLFSQIEEQNTCPLLFTREKVITTS